MSGRDVAAVAGLLADRSRAAMVEVLLDGRDHTVQALAQAAGVASSTATGHVGRLEAGGLVLSRRDGRKRLVRLAGREAAAAYEALAELSRERPVNGLRGWTRREELRVARTCYDHLAGKLGVSIADAALRAGAIEPGFSLGSSASCWFARLGVEVASLPYGRRPLLRVCTDWTEHREHLAGTLGAAIWASRSKPEPEPKGERVKTRPGARSSSSVHRCSWTTAAAMRVAAARGADASTAPPLERTLLHCHDDHQPDASEQHEEQVGVAARHIHCSPSLPGGASA